MTDQPTATSTSTSPANADPAPHYRRPGFLTKHVLNQLVQSLTRVGISVWGSRVLEVRGRTSGKLRRVPVNLLTFDGHEYLVSARGNGQWVRNVRAAGGELDLLVGKRRQAVTARELTDAEKVPVLREYLRRWKAEVGVFFDGVSAASTDAEIAAIASKHPAFVLDGRP